MDSVSKTKEVKSKFSLAGLSVQGVRSGERAPQEIKPGVEVSNQYNKFRITKTAAEIIGLKTGDRVKLFVTNSEEMYGRYLLAVAKDTDELSAKVATAGKKEGFGSLTFNYSGVWSKMIQCENPTAMEKSIHAFVAENMGVVRNKTGYVNCKVTYGIEHLEEVNEDNPLVDPISGEEFTKVYLLIDPVKEAVELKFKADEAENAGDAESADEAENATVSDDLTGMFNDDEQ